MYSDFKIIPKKIPPLDKGFKPLSLQNNAFIQALKDSGKSVPVAVSLQRNDGLIFTYRTNVFSDASGCSELNLKYIERLVKTLLWIYGGWKVVIGGPYGIGKYIEKVYSPHGIRAFDSEFMSRIYGRPFTVELTEYDKVPETNDGAKPIGRHLEGCRIGFDAGGSDRKVSAVIDGKVVYSEEVIWQPKIETDPDYHKKEILSAIKTAASYLPKVDAIGVSAAGIYINNKVMAASLFMNVPPDLFEKKVKDIFIDIQKEMNSIPIEVVNDGDVTALAGAMNLNDTNVLGIAMGTSEAGGYVDSNGRITGWLNELAFVPVDLNADAAIDEWSGDYGCGVKYFSQEAVIKLAPTAGIILDNKLTQAEKLEVVQGLFQNGDARAAKIFETIGCYLGYSIAHYADFYDIKHILILGRVTSGVGGNRIYNTANNVLETEFPHLSEKIKIHLPDESDRRVGQSIAAASLPQIQSRL